MRPFTTALWNTNLPVFESIKAHPFVTELIDGSLDKQIFADYIYQDALYLNDYARVLFLLASKAPNQKEIVTLGKYAQDAIATEQALHEHYLSVLPEPSFLEKNRACFAYTNFLMAQCAIKSYEEGLASIFPCFWIYERIGHYAFHASTVENNPYQAWLDTYNSTEFEKVTQEMIDLIELKSALASPDTKQAMQEAYAIASKMEYNFWDSAYHGHRI